MINGVVLGVPRCRLLVPRRLGLVDSGRDLRDPVVLAHPEMYRIKSLLIHVYILRYTIIINVDAFQIDCFQSNFTHISELSP